MKKGAFQSLLPIKPIIIKYNDESSNNFWFSLATGSIDSFIHFLLTLCFNNYNVTVIELPIINLNGHVLENYRQKGLKEKWEIYACAVRDIYARIGNFEKSEADLKDSYEYVEKLKANTKKFK